MAIVDTTFFGPGGAKKLSSARNLILPDRNNYFVKDNQIIVYLSITPKECRTTPPSGTPVFPAILDTGNTTSLTMTEEQFEYCIHPDTRDQYLSVGDEGRVNGQPASLVNGDAWLHHQEKMTCLPKRPIRLSLNRGIVVIHDQDPRAKRSALAWFTPRFLRSSPAKPWKQPLPTLGLEALVAGRLSLEVFGYERHVKLFLGRKHASDDDEAAS